MAEKYYVWGEGVWRELDVASGRVSGWRRRARFVFVRQGRLLVARRRPVLRALEALAAGQPSAAADGPRLSHRSKTEGLSKRTHETLAAPPAAPTPAPPPLPIACEHHHCCAHRCQTDTRPLGRRTTATQCGLLLQQENRPVAAADYSSEEEFVSPGARRPPLALREHTEVNELFYKTSAAADTSDEMRARTGSRSASSRSADHCKELIITEADVLLLRGFVARTRPGALARFDADLTYQRLLFHAINPLVHVERCPRLEGLLRPAGDADKENKEEHSSVNKVRAPVSGSQKSPERPSGRRGVTERNNKLEKKVAVIKIPETNGVSDRPKAKPERSAERARSPPGAHVISKRASSGKEYSNLEDHAIVAWVSSGSRASLVSGNRLWRELQDQYERLTGRERSWHSLRNRYLRYILPALGTLGLEPAQVARLRAAAATGAIKTKNRVAVRRHSAYETPPLSAASRRPPARRPDHDLTTDADDGTGPSSPKRRSLRSQPQKSTSNKDESSDEFVSKTSGRKELNGPVSGSKEAGSGAGGSKELHSETSGGRAPRTPRYSEVTRRFAARHRASTSSSPPHPASPPRSAPTTRSRRLFNPNANM